MPNWLPALIAAGRTFVTVGAMALFWIVTGWPGGALAMTFAAIVELLLAPRADETYGAAMIFTIGAVLDLILTAIVAFAVLPDTPNGRLCRLQPRDRRMPGPHRCIAAARRATVAGRTVHRDDDRDS